MRIFNSREPQPVLVGDVAYFRVVLSSENDSDLIGIIMERQRRMKEEMDVMVKQTLGPEFEVRSMTIGRGSVEILIIIASTYYVVSRWKNFIESLELLKRQIESVFRQQVPLVGKTEATWTPGPAVANVQAGTFSAEAPRFTQAGLLIYLIVSHAALLTAFLWLLIKKLS